jgi:hypothetical protein
LVATIINCPVKEDEIKKYIILRKNNPDERIQDPVHKKETKNTSSWARGEGGHTSAPENPAIQQTEPEYRPSQTPFIPKGARMHTKTPKSNELSTEKPT